MDGNRITKSGQQSEQHKDDQSMVKDQASLEQICKVMKHLVVAKYNTVFDYDSEGDLFYMVLHGEVDCKIKMAR